MNTKILGVIPARGGSKRLPRKNIKLLNGRPLIDYTIKACLNSKLLHSYVFSTEDPEIREIAIKCGGNAPFLRPPELALDHIRNSGPMIHALDFMEKEMGLNYDAVMLLQPTSPFRTAKHIDAAINHFISSDAQSLASVRGPYKKREINLKRIVNNRLENLIDKNEEYFLYNAAIYIVKKDWLIDHQSFTSSDETQYIMSERASVDIDTSLDFSMAAALMTEGNLND
jgi:CMP-N,N'-diacetyllegionaminic acid synthase